MNTTLRVNEIFHSIQGEGILAGVPSVFIRLAGCPLRCRWCDTRYAWSERSGRQTTPQQIVADVEQYHCRSAVITGGEPLIWPAIGKLTQLLHVRGYQMTVETAGIEYRKFYCDLLSLSVKLANSLPPKTNPAKRAAHQKLIANLTPIRRLLADHRKYQLKFVVARQNHVDQIKAFLRQLDNIDPDRIMIMPQAARRNRYRRLAPAVARWAIQAGWRFSPRLQIELYNGRPGR